ncbi:MAG: Phenylpyruvate C(3)-methyltransferase [Candidatus Anoxychlamydiales bacterium]|nr:Phenylpyruvate C(3)-methyltransferase [Candidatus Anoxychlamydiales bacterium]
MKKSPSLKTDITSPNHNQVSLEKSFINFVSYGIAAQALCFIEEIGILKILLNEGKIGKEEIKKFTNISLVTSTLFTLMGADIVLWDGNDFYLTIFGKHIAKKIGFITLPLKGYEKLISKQKKLLNNPNSFVETDINYSTVALSSISFGSEDLDPLLINIFKKLNYNGTICDLGCGTGEKLVRICKSTNSYGLGIEKNKDVVKESKKFIKNFSKVEIIKEDILKLSGVWEDVTIALASFVLHDIQSQKNTSKLLHSYKTHFPRMKFLIIVDIVSPSKKIPTIMPGFDYVHGLQGFIPRNYEETIEVFENANYKVFQEIKVPNMPNTFIWILQH